MVVIRVNNNGDLTYSKPCCNCIYYLKLYGIKNVYYSDKNGEIVKEKMNDIESQHSSISHIRYLEFLKTNSKDLLLSFDETKRKKNNFKVS